MNRIVLLHRSTGLSIFLGNTNYYVNKLTKKSDLKSYVRKYSKESKSDCTVSEKHFASPLSLKNYPYDYYNVWVKNAGNTPFMNVPTLEILTKQFEIIVFKHCYSASNTMEDSGSPDIDSEERRIENYKLQYESLKRKMHEFPETKFIIWTPAVNVKNQMTEDEARRISEFYRWILEKWDEKEDNIYLWDFYKYETEGGLYFKDEYAFSSNDSHPGKEFSAHMAPILARFIVDVADGVYD